MTQKDCRIEDADTEIQNRLFELAERACRREGDKHVFDDWKPDLWWTKTYRS